MKRSANTLDISMPITEAMSSYPGDPQPEFHATREGGVLLTVLRMSLHAGTHVDAPLHVLPDGPAVDALPQDRLCGPACVVQARTSPIDAAEVRSWPLRSRDRVLVRGASGSCTFTEDGARALLDHDLLLLGVEDFGPDDTGSPDLPVHRLLLGRSIGLLENLCLAQVVPGRYHLTCLALSLPGREAAWARAVLSW